MSKIVKCEVDILGKTRPFVADVYLPDSYDEAGERKFKTIVVLGDNIFYPQAETDVSERDSEPTQDSPPRAYSLRVKECMDLLAETGCEAVVAAVEIAKLEQFLLTSGVLRNPKKDAPAAILDFIVNSVVPRIYECYKIDGAQSTAFCAFTNFAALVLNCAAQICQSPRLSGAFYGAAVCLPDAQTSGGKKLLQACREFNFSKNCAIEVFAANGAEEDKKAAKQAAQNLVYAFELANAVSCGGAKVKLHVNYDRGASLFQQVFYFCEFASAFIAPAAKVHLLN